MSLPLSVFNLAGVQSFDGTASDVINLPHDTELEVAEATIAFSFVADDVNTRQGLFTKDAGGFSGGGNHFAIYVENGSLVARFQDGSASTILSQAGLVAGQEYEVAATFGANGVELYVDGAPVASVDDHIMSWTGNQEYLQIGGLGWASQTGQDGFVSPFSGQIADVQVFDQVLDATQVAELAGISDPTNTAPAAVTDLATVNEDDTTTIAVLTNDSDPDGDPVIITNLGTA
ncbi:MAG: LamG domain-containing protein, partial [Hyphomicrobiales bacterium]|nr:LamG domain-containing protein [Hyphomicrobiales bacterium]